MTIIVKRLLLLSAVCALAGLFAAPTSILASQIFSGASACPSSGNKAVVSAQTKFQTGSIQGATGNTGRVYIGGSDVTTTAGVYVSAGGIYTFQPQGNSTPYDFSTTYIACTVSGDSITYLYVR